MKRENLLFSLLFLSLVAISAYMAKNNNDINEKLEENSIMILNLEQVTVTDIPVGAGAEVYVPAYSSISSFTGETQMNLAIDLSVRNTDPANSIIISYIDFYNTEGRVSKKFLEKPIKIAPMATVNFHIARNDTSGGIGANFYLRWNAETDVNEPFIEAIMLGAAGTQGYSWSSQGLVVKRF